MFGLLKNPRLQVSMAIALVTMGLFYVWWITDYQPQNEEVVEMARHVAELRTKNQDAKRMIAQLGLDQIREKLDTYDAQYALVQDLVPPASAGVFSSAQLLQMARQYNVVVEDVQKMTGGVYKNFATEGYNLKVSGRYHDVGALITHLLSLERITHLRNVDLQAVDLGSGTGWVLRGTFQIVSFALIEEGESDEEETPETQGAESAQAPQTDE